MVAKIVVLIWVGLIAHRRYRITDERLRIARDPAYRQEVQAEYDELTDRSIAVIKRAPRIAAVVGYALVIVRVAILLVLFGALGVWR